MFYWQHKKLGVSPIFSLQSGISRVVCGFLPPLITITEPRTAAAAAATELTSLISLILEVSKREIGES